MSLKNGVTLLATEGTAKFNLYKGTKGIGLILFKGTAPPEPEITRAKAEAGAPGEVLKPFAGVCTQTDEGWFLNASGTKPPAEMAGLVTKYLKANHITPLPAKVELAAPKTDKTPTATPTAQPGADATGQQQQQPQPTTARSVRPQPGRGGAPQQGAQPANPQATSSAKPLPPPTAKPQTTQPTRVAVKAAQATTAQTAQPGAQAQGATAQQATAQPSTAQPATNDAAVKLREQVPEYGKELESARRQLKALKRGGFISLKALNALVKTYEQAPNRCKQPQELEQEVAKFHKAFKTQLEALKKSKSKELAAWKKYQKQLRQARKRSWELEQRLHAGKEAKEARDHIEKVEIERKKKMDKADGVKAIQALEQAGKDLEATKAIRDKGKKAHDQAKKERKKDLDMLPVLEKRRDQVSDLQDELKRLPGTRDLRKELDDLLDAANGLVKETDLGPTGVAAACKMLTKEQLEGLLERAKTASASFKPDLGPLTIKSLEKAKGLLEESKVLTHRYKQEFYAEELAGLYEKASEGQQPDADMAAEFDSLCKYITDNLDEHRTAKANCFQQEPTLKKALEDLAAVAPPKVMQSLTMVHGEALERYGEQDFLAAEELYTALAAEVAQELKDGQARMAEWDKVKDRAPALKASFLELISWPEAAKWANKGLEDLRAVEALVKKRNYPQAAKELKKLIKSEAELRKSVDGLFTSSQLFDFGERQTEAKKQVEEAREDADLAFERLRAAAPDSDEAPGGPVDMLTQAVAAWQSYLEKPPKEQYDTAIVTLDKRRDEALAAIAAAAKAAEEATKSESQQTKLKDEAKAARAEAQQKLPANPQKITQAIQEARALKVDTTALNAEFDALQKEQQQLEDDLKKSGLKDDNLEKAQQGIATQMHSKWKKLEATAQQALQDQKATNQKQAKVVLASLNTKREKLKGLGNEKTKEFLKEVDKELMALEGLLDSGDTELIAAAEAEAATIMARAEKGAQAGPEGYAAVESKRKDLAKLVNNKNLTKVMSETQAKLVEEVIKANASTARLLPEEALAELVTLEKKITASIKLADEERKKYDVVKVRKEAIQKKFKKTAAAANVTVSVKVATKEVPALHDYKKFEKRFNAQLGQVKTFSKSEGRIDQALTLLTKVEGELDSIAQADSPKQALQDLDSQTRNNKKQVQSWHQAFSAAKKSFKEVDLVRAEKSVTAAGKAGDLKQIKELSKLVSRAGKIVKAYEDAKTEELPLDLASVRADFKVANDLLAQAKSTAARVAKNPGGARLRAKKDLQQVNNAYKVSAQKHRVALTKLLAVIKESGAKPPTELAKGVPEDIKVVTAKLTALSNLFKVEAFTNEITSLSDPELDETKRKAARESALKKFRTFQQRLLKDPFAARLADRKNSFLPVNVETGLLMAALKNLERSVVSQA